MASKKHATTRQAAREELSPLERCEAIRIEMGKRVDERLKAVRDAVGEKEIEDCSRWASYPRVNGLTSR